MTEKTLNQEQRKENARYWAAASAESRPERAAVCPDQVMARAEGASAHRTRGDILRLKGLTSWVKAGGPGRRVALILIALLVGVPVALLILGPVLDAIATLVLGILGLAFVGRGLAHDHEANILHRES